MNPQVAALRSNRAVVVSVIIAAVAVTLLALAGLAKLIGWPLSAPVVPTPMSIASPASQVAGSAAELGLAPGETVVVPADSASRPAPMMPHYNAPTPPTPAPATSGPPSEATAPRQPPAIAPAQRAMPRAAPRPEPRTPSFARGDAHPTSPLDTWPNPAPARCPLCGRVVSTTTWPDMAEVRIRFEDGSTRTLRSSAPSPWHVGDRVRVEHGRLVRD